VNLLWAYLSDPAHWQGGAGIPARLGQHLAYSGVTLLIAAAIGVPLGLWIGHTGRGRLLVVNLVNGMRSVPTLGLLFVDQRVDVLQDAAVVHARVLKEGC